MSGAQDTQPTPSNVAADPSATAGDWGWYLYGITRAEERTSDGEHGPAGLGTLDSAEVIAQDDLEAVVRRVPRDEFAPETVQARADDPTWLEEIATHHNAVVNAIHQERAILPAKLGSVYASVEELRAALAQAHDTLLTHLGRLAGCDEWGVRLYADLARVRQRADAENAGVRGLEAELVSASPGRAYFLQRKLADERAAAAEGALDDLVERSLVQLRQHAADIQVSKRITDARVGQQDGEVEVVRVAVLVPRDTAEMFQEHLKDLVESEIALRCEYSGPWPPYSFANPPEQPEEVSP